METQEVTTNCIKYKEGYKYRLAVSCGISTGILGHNIKTDYITLDVFGFMVLKKGYAWDGADGPTIDTKNSMRGSAAHDALYQLIRLGLLPHSCKKVADELLESICVEDGMWKIRARIWKDAVADYGEHATLPSSEKPIIVAP